MMRIAIVTDKMISQLHLDLLIHKLQAHEYKGVSYPWLLADNTTIDPLDVLNELRMLRIKVAALEELYLGETDER